MQILKLLQGWKESEILDAVTAARNSSTEADTVRNSSYMKKVVNNTHHHHHHIIIPVCPNGFAILKFRKLLCI